MPAYDRTGPSGQGPVTGRGIGFCRGFRRGFGRGYGRGFGFRRNPVQEPVILTEKQEKEILEQELKELKTDIQEIEKRLKEIK